MSVGDFFEPFTRIDEVYPGRDHPTDELLDLLEKRYRGGDESVVPADSLFKRELGPVLREYYDREIGPLIDKLQAQLDAASRVIAPMAGAAALNMGVEMTAAEFRRLWDALGMDDGVDDDDN